MEEPSKPIPSTQMERVMSSISNISQHLTVLRKIYMVNRRKEANFMFYSISDPRISELLGTLKHLYCSEH